MDFIGVGSLGLIAIISTFIGAVMTLQIAFQLVSDFIPKTIIGSVNRDSSILELSPTISAIVLAGKIGSAISSEIGTMRVTEQIDALGNHGNQFPWLSDPAQDHCRHYNGSGTGHHFYVLKYYWRLYWAALYREPFPLQNTCRGSLQILILIPLPLLWSKHLYLGLSLLPYLHMKVFT